MSRKLINGLELSGGQWQRIALTRAAFALHDGARLLMLDEPTANLDVRGEAELYDRFVDLARGATTVLVSHRFSTVRRADRIVVLDRGRIIEDGTHAELMRFDGRYAALFRLQAHRYGEAVTS
jgi:ATP-binding cassette subfamily B protein